MAKATPSLWVKDIREKKLSRCRRQIELTFIVSFLCMMGTLHRFPVVYCERSHHNNFDKEL